MRILPVRFCARRMAMLLCSVAALDVAAAFLVAKPQVWCAIIPALIPIFTPAAIFSIRVPFKG
jgi:hypothetical protein